MKDITVVIPCYKQAQYVKQAVVSCIVNVYPPVSIIVILMDAESQKEANNLCKLSPLVHCYCKPQMSTPKARNLGFSLVETEWVLPLDADDRLDIDTLEEFNKCEGDVIHGYAKSFGQTKNWWTKWPNPVESFTLETIKDHDPIPSCSLVRKSVWQAVGGYNETLIHGCEDWEFWLNIKKHGFIFTPCPSAFYWYRVAENSRDHKAKKQLNKIVQAIHKIHADIF